MTARQDLSSTNEQIDQEVARHARALLPLVALVKYLEAHLHYNPDTGRWKTVSGHHRVARWVDRRCDHHGYPIININKKTYLAHRLAFLWMTGKMPLGIDHADGDKKNNKWSNLRPATTSQNLANAKISRRNTSGYKGVFWDKKLKRWTAIVVFQQKTVFRRTYRDINDAVVARQRIFSQYFGEFARHD